MDNDNLRIDVWDFNPEENVSEKFRKIGDIKDSRGLRKFIKETLNASAGKTTYDLLGSVEIPLKVSFSKVFKNKVGYRWGFFVSWGSICTHQLQGSLIVRWDPLS